MAKDVVKAMPSDHLGGAVPGDPFRARIPVRDLAIASNHRCAVGKVLDGRLVQVGVGWIRAIGQLRAPSVKRLEDRDPARSGTVLPRPGLAGCWPKQPSDATTRPTEGGYVRLGWVERWVGARASSLVWYRPAPPDLRGLGRAPRRAGMVMSPGH